VPSLRSPIRAGATLLVAAATLLSNGVPANAAVSVRDVGRALGLPSETRSWDIDVGRLNRDRVPDLVISYHGAVEFFRTTRSGIQRVFARTPGDAHGCAVADVNRDGLGDVYCTRGAHRGTITKANRLWIQTSPGIFQDRAARYGVEDPLGRGRHPAFVAINDDRRPDLFIGNGSRRRDGRRTPNRTFVNVAGSRFDEVFVGLTDERDALCAQAVDQNGDGREDLLVCSRRLLLYRNRPGGFLEVARRLGVGSRGLKHARLARLNPDRRPDLIVVRERMLSVRRGTRRGSFGKVTYSRRLTKGRWVAVGDIDGRRGRDLLVVQSCTDGTNVPDVLLLHRRSSWGFRRVGLPQPRHGCGDVAAALDLNANGRDEFVVLNGWRRSRGPVQVLTTRWG
jgi:hypothetical protein